MEENNDEVVARDGIEPPTLAFSGPRSTTEQPGQRLTRGFEVGKRADLVVLEKDPIADDSWAQAREPHRHQRSSKSGLCRL